ncbi:MAG: HepT-like ribonuclease domain-containing protein [Candidatus Hodarchaeales archaeon]|jgi:uncharacterized protein with HEPN domain
MHRSLELILHDILSSIDLINVYIGNLTINDFMKDKKTQDAVIRNLEIIGEAVKHIPEAIKKNYPYDWREVAGLRDILIHHYFGVSLNIIWDIIQKELPGLKITIISMKDGEN